MEITYTCNNRQCLEVLKTTYVYTLNLEKIMDEKNIAQMFCPHCKSKLEAE